MLSMPPATAMPTSPDLTIWAPRITAIMPEAHILLTVRADELSGTPLYIPACRAGACPSPAPSTLPMIVYSAHPESSPVLSSAPRIAAAPSFGAGTDDRLPPSLPIGVRAAPTITTFSPASIVCMPSTAYMIHESAAGKIEMDARIGRG